MGARAEDPGVGTVITTQHVRVFTTWFGVVIVRDGVLIVGLLHRAQIGARSVGGAR